MKTPAVASLRHLPRLAALLAGLALGCGGGAAEPGDPDAGTPPPAASFTLALVGRQAARPDRGSATVEVTVDPRRRLHRRDHADARRSAALAHGDLRARHLGGRRDPRDADGDRGGRRAALAADRGRGQAATSGGSVATKPLTVTVTGPPGSLDTSFARRQGRRPGRRQRRLRLRDGGRSPTARSSSPASAAEHRGDFAARCAWSATARSTTTFGDGGKVMTDFGGRQRHRVRRRGAGRRQDRRRRQPRRRPAAARTSRSCATTPTAASTPRFGTGGKVTTDVRRRLRHRVRAADPGRRQDRRRRRHATRAAAPASTSRWPATTATAPSTPASATARQGDHQPGHELERPRHDLRAGAAGRSAARRASSPPAARATSRSRATTANGSLDTASALRHRQGHGA